MKSIITKLAVHNGIYNLVDNKDEDTKSNNNFLISAHRNYISSDIENTKEYILLMNDNDYVSYIEIDARLTKDKKIILSHDNDLIVDGKHQKIADLTYEEVSNLKIGDNNKLIDLDNAIMLANKGIIINLKFDNNIIELCNELNNELEGYDTSNMIFQTTNIDGIRYLNNNNDLNCQLLINNKDDLKYIDEFKRVSINIHLFNEELYKELSYKNKKISLFVINNKEDLDKVLNIVGDNYKDINFITNYPDVIDNLLKENSFRK